MSIVDISFLSSHSTFCRSMWFARSCFSTLSSFAFAVLEATTCVVLINNKPMLVCNIYINRLVHTYSCSITNVRLQHRYTACNDDLKPFPCWIMNSLMKTWMKCQINYKHDNTLSPSTCPVKILHKGENYLILVKLFHCTNKSFNLTTILEQVGSSLESLLLVSCNLIGNAWLLWLYSRQFNLPRCYFCAVDNKK